MTNEIQQFRYDQLMRRVNGIIGPGSKVAEVITELFPVLDVERIPGELLWLSGWRLAFGGALESSAAGETARIQLMNPNDSGKLIVCSSFIASASGSTSLLWTVRNSALPDTVSPELLRDTRAGASEKPTGQIRSQSAAGNTVATNRLLIAANAPFTFNDDNGNVVLFPGTGLEVGMSTQNALLSVSFSWRERVFEVSEVSGF